MNGDDVGAAKMAIIDRPDLGMQIVLKYGRSGAGIPTFQLEHHLESGKATDCVWQRPREMTTDLLVEWLAREIDDESAKELADLFSARHPEIFSSPNEAGA